MTVCPRCGGETTRRVADSPVAGSWEVFGCNKCNYLWRSTEDLKDIVKLRDKDLKEALWLYKRKPA